MKNIIYKRGNIVKAKEQNILHGCNCQGVMGSGVALSIKNNFPKAYRQYKKYIKHNGKDNIFGSIQIVKCDNKNIFNLFTQKYYGKLHKKFDYNNFNQIIVKLVDEVLNNKKYKNEIALPRIGAGRGKGRWDKIEKIIKKNTKDKNIQATIYIL
jgi:O-acetyl-ADP-ribose deacetylase (regulator of RNase III)